MNKLNIIIVENDEDEQLFMNEGFASSGKFNIIKMVRNGNELFDYLAEPGAVLPDIILSDLNMPGKNGYDILETIIEKGIDIPVIITSTSSTKTIIEKCLSMKAAAYLVKPDTFIQYPSYAQSLYNIIQEKRLV